MKQKNKTNKKVKNKNVEDHLRCQIFTFMSLPVDATTPYFLLNLTEEIKC